MYVCMKQVMKTSRVDQERIKIKNDDIWPDFGIDQYLIKYMTPPVNFFVSQAFFLLYLLFNVSRLWLYNYKHIQTYIDLNLCLQSFFSFFFVYVRSFLLSFNTYSLRSSKRKFLFCFVQIEFNVREYNLLMFKKKITRCLKKKQTHLKNLVKKNYLTLTRFCRENSDFITAAYRCLMWAPLVTSCKYILYISVAIFLSDIFH